LRQIGLERIEDFGVLGARWRALEAHADGGFFRSWTFLGCLADERFAGARLLSVTEDGVDLALGLLGEGQGRLWLNETGDKVGDSVFIEWNGLLVRRECVDVVAPALRTAARLAGTLVLSGVDTDTLTAARHAGWLAPPRSRAAPCVDLASAGADFLATLSGNTRAQIRRSMRLFGPSLRLQRAETLASAQGFFAEMVEAHQDYWRTRGKPGAFAEAWIRRFHAALIDRAWPLGQADLLRIGCGRRHIGTLYAFIDDGRVLSYQSGFRYGPDKREKPGLVCHALAIDHYARQGLGSYDFLAGEDRYKQSLANGGGALHWAVLHRPWSVSGAIAKLREMMR